MLAVAASPDGQMIAAGNKQGRVYVWQRELVEADDERTLASWQPVGRLQAHPGYVLRLRWSPTGAFFVTCGADGLAKRWPLSHLHPTAISGMPSEENAPHPQPVVVGSMVGIPPPRPPLELSVCPLAPFSVGKAWLWDAALSADGAYLITASSDGHARLWDLNSLDALCEPVVVYAGHQKAITAVALHDT